MASGSAGDPRAVSDLRGVDLLTEIATRFYLRGESQVQIARRMGLDPSTVSRYLKRARDEGIVRVEIRPPRRQNVDQGRLIAEHFGLARVVVASGAGPESTLAPVAADFIGGLLRSGMRVSTGWGHTLASVYQQMEPGSVTGLSISQLAGGLSGSVPGIQGHELVRQLANLFPDSRVTYLHAPSIVDSPFIRDAIMSDSSVQGSLEMARSSELALVGIGEVEADATLIQSGHLGPADLAHLRTLGTVGSMNSRFFAADGRPITWLDDRTMGINWDELRAIPLVVAVAGGAHKVEAICGALRTGCVRMLVTDEAAADRLVDEAGR